MADVAGKSTNLADDTLVRLCSIYNRGSCKLNFDLLLCCKQATIAFVYKSKMNSSFTKTNNLLKRVLNLLKKTVHEFLLIASKTFALSKKVLSYKNGISLHADKNANRFPFADISLQSCRSFHAFALRAHNQEQFICDLDYCMLP